MAQTNTFIPGNTQEEYVIQGWYHSSRSQSLLSLVPLSLTVASVPKDADVVSILLARERGKMEGGSELRLSSSRSFPRNATSVIWDKCHGQPRSWTGPRAPLYMQWGQVSVSKDERVKDGMLRWVQDPPPQHLPYITFIHYPNPSQERLTDSNSRPRASHKESECP